MRQVLWRKNLKRCMNYFKILYALQRGDKVEADVPVEEQRAFLKRIGEAKNDIDRGYKQYLCQNYFVPEWKVWLFNFAAAVIVPIVVFYYLVKGLFVRKEAHVDAMIESKGMDEVVPFLVREKYSPDNSHWKEGSSMSPKDFDFLMILFLKAPHHPYFVLKAWMNVVQYSDMIRRHSPNVLIQFGEFSYSSSILTAYCHRFNIRHINIMHGEKTWFIRDAYFHYDECYVWDEHYAKIFRELKAEPTQFIVAVPESLHIDVEKYRNEKDYADYKYYLGEYNEEELDSIVRSMAFVEQEGKKVKYRPHPRYSDFALLRKYVGEDKIETPSEVSIMESISNLEFAVGSFSTVLSQAYFSGKKVILDDVTFRELYDKLKNMRYVLAEKVTDKLSKHQIV